ncbi:MAG: NAD(P)H-hydrate dehydratase [Promethearchaeota archaeon]
MTSEEMFVFDENSEYLGIPKGKLMENAGSAVARFIEHNYSPNEKEVHVFCGTGNNGGDGFVVARHLASIAKEVFVHLLGSTGGIKTAEALENFECLKNTRFSLKINAIRDSSDVEKILIYEKAHALIIDALLGAGIKGSVIREPIASCIKKINSLSLKHNIPVISVDVPSGMDPDTGILAEPHIEAREIVSFHRKKTGLVGKRELQAGVHIFPIGIPPEAGWIVGPGDVKLLFKNGRSTRSTKGMNGKLLIIGGSNQYTGAPALAGMAACRCGVDLVNICAPGNVAGTIRSYSPDLIVTPLEGPFISLENLTVLEKRIRWADTILIGPGAGLMEGTKQAIRKACQISVSEGKNVVIDADGLKAVASNLDLIDSGNVVITPHAGEFSILSGVSTKNLGTVESKLAYAREFVKVRACTLLLKGPEDIIINRGSCKLNLTGTPAMTAGGTGDVLAGITSAFVSLFTKRVGQVYLAAAAAAHVNGLVGQQIEKEAGGPHITASMMVEGIAGILSRFEISS